MDTLGRLGHSLFGDAGFFVLLLVVALLWDGLRERRFFRLFIVLFSLVLAAATFFPSVELLAAPLRWMVGDLHSLDTEQVETRDAHRQTLQGRCAAETHRIVVLAGGVLDRRTPSMSSRRRVMAAIDLLRSWPLPEDDLESEALGEVVERPTVFFSGGPAHPQAPYSSAAVMLRTFETWAPLQAERARVYLEEQSLTTYENALYTRSRFSQLKEEPLIHLVTDAIHMPRSILSFEKQGFEVCPVVAQGQLDSARGLFSFENGVHFVSVLHEYIGLVAYAVQGRL